MANTRAFRLDGIIARLSWRGGAPARG